MIPLIIGLLSSGFAQDIEFYGVLRAAYSRANQRTLSIGQTSASAPTHAKRVVSTADDRPLSAISANQSRLGLRVTKDQLYGRLEMDFFDPNDDADGGGVETSKLDTRLRTAQVIWDISESFALRFGLGKSSFSGLFPHTFNFVGNGYYAGNTGFLNEEAGLDIYYRSFFSSIVMARPYEKDRFNNDTGELDDPGVILRLGVRGEDFEYGLSGARIDLPYSLLSTANVDQEAWGAKTWFRMNFRTLEFRIEYYQGQNMDSIGMRGITRATPTTDLGAQESGGWLSTRWRF